MTLNQWSLVVFATTLFYFFMIFFSIYGTPSIAKYTTLCVSWIVAVVTTFLYGLSTGQIGFVLMAVLEIVVVIIVFVTTERIFNDENS